MKQENEDRKLPVIEIVPGVEFYVDVTQGELTDTLNSKNKIGLLDMIILSDHFELLFDKKTRNVKTGSWDVANDNRYAYVWLRPLGVYDPEGAKIMNELHPPELPKDLPVIDIEGTKFLWYKELTALVQADNTYNQIHKSTLDMRGGEMGIYFDRLKKFVPFPHEINARRTDEKLPPHIRFIPVSEINQKIRLAEAKLKHPAPKRKGMRV